jgi:hypothetical protein
LLTFSKTFWTMQQMYSSRRRLLWIEIKQFFISLYYLFIFSHQSKNFIASIISTATAIPTQVVQWLRLALSNGPNNLPFPHLRTETDPLSETLFFF